MLCLLSCRRIVFYLSRCRADHSLFALGSHSAAYASHFEQRCSQLSGLSMSVLFAPVLSMMLRRYCGFSSIGQGRSIFLLNGCSS